MTSWQEDSVSRDFFAWQCRVRQVAMREQGGRPSRGMFARIEMPASCAGISVVFLLQREDAADYVAQFRYIVAASYDPQERRERGLQLLSSTYYQNSPLFLPVVTVVLAQDSLLVRGLLAAGSCRFLCDESGHAFSFSGEVTEAQADSDLCEGSLCHNRLFSQQHSPQRVLAIHAVKITREQV